MKKKWLIEKIGNIRLLLINVFLITWTVVCINEVAIIEAFNEISYYPRLYPLCIMGFKIGAIVLLCSLIYTAYTIFREKKYRWVRIPVGFVLFFIGFIILTLIFENVDIDFADKDETDAGYIELRVTEVTEGITESITESVAKKLAIEDTTEYIWTRESDEEVIVQLDFPLQEGVHELVLPPYSEDARIEYRLDGKSVSELHSKLPEKISEAVACDYTFDGVLDIIIVGVDDSGEKLISIYRGSEETGYDDEFEFLNRSDDELKLLGPLKYGTSASDVVDALTNKKTNGTFSSYKEAYSSVVAYFEARSTNNCTYTYDLVYIDEDDTPELLVDLNGCWFYVYELSDGTVRAPIVGADYGMGASVFYQYAPHKNCIYNFGHSVDTYYYYYYKISDGVQIQTYSETYYYEDEDSDSETTTNDGIYKDYTNENLSSAETKERLQQFSKYQFEDLTGVYSAEEFMSYLQ